MVWRLDGDSLPETPIELTWIEVRGKTALHFKACGSCAHVRKQVSCVSHMPVLQLSAFIVHLFVVNFGTNLPFLPPSLAVVGNNLGFYKQASIICTTVLGVILKPPFCEAGFNLSHGLQTRSPVGLTTFHTLDKLPISLGFAISVLFSCVCVCVCVCKV